MLYIRVDELETSAVLEMEISLKMLEGEWECWTEVNVGNFGSLIKDTGRSMEMLDRDECWKWKSH